MADLEVCLEVIQRYWTRHDYHIIVVSNGLADGFAIPDVCRDRADTVIELPENAGHLKGNSQLLKAGFSKVPGSMDFTVMLEADNWIFTDEWIAAYLERMDTERAVWASAEWIEKYHTVALDAAIVRTDFIREHPEVLDFTVHAESHVCNTLRALGTPYLLIPECMPVHVPRQMRRFYPGFGGRRRTFTAAKMVTHHIEELPGGLADKKVAANIMLERREFPVERPVRYRMERFKLRWFEWLLKVVPRSRWFKKKRMRQMNRDDG